MSELQKLITKLQTDIQTQQPWLSHIKDPVALVNNLKDLNAVIGHTKLKQSVALQTNYLIKMSGDNTHKQNVMLNTLLYGPPGVGKTTIAVKLAKIWDSLGYLNQPQTGTLDSISKMLPQSSGDNENETLIFTAIFVLYYIGYFLYFVCKKCQSYFGAKGIVYIFIFITVIILLLWLYFKNKNSRSVNTDTIDEKYTPTDLNSSESSNVSVQSKPQNSKNQNNTPKVNRNDDQIIKVVSRQDFVSGYLGQTAQKTKKLLESSKGKVLFIDEAYSLLNDREDPYGMEALTTLNLFLSEHPKDIIVIMAGYENLMKRGIFKVQPGLVRRFMWHFRCDTYDADELFQIFKSQLNKHSWSLENESAILQLFRNNIDAFPSYGGDTERLAFLAQLEHSSKSTETPYVLTPEDIEVAINKLRENNIHGN